jgi:anti-anti-sigma factor
MSEERREAFYNKIFFCDVIGYSRLDPQGQFECQRALNRVLGGVLARLGCTLEEDVIALPTGDGVVLNFLAPEPDIHLRTAILSLEGLNAPAEGGEAPFGLRIGLNSHVDTWVHDINGKKNVVGSGINMAQRIMDLGAHGQILMHDRVRHDLATYPEYASHVVFRGTYGVKHGVELPVAQFVDETCAYISSDPAAPPAKTAAPSGLDLDDILRSRIQENVLTLRLDHRAGANLPAIQDYVEEFLDGFEAYQRLKVSTSWIVDEMLANVFHHAGLAPDASFQLKLDRTRTGLQISVLQPDVPAFRLADVIGGGADPGSFMQMMHARGLKWREHRLDGQLEIGVELPFGIDLRPMPALQLDLKAPQDGVAGPVDAETRARIVVARPDLARIDESNWQSFWEWLFEQVQAANARRGALLLDFRSVEYMSSRALRGLSRGKQQAADGVRLALFGAVPRVREILAISRYDLLIDVHEDRDAALAALAGNLPA